MITEELKKEKEAVYAAIENAGRAPSVHNSQPWRFRVREDRVELFADCTRWLPTTDADGRDLLISCGAALHHLRLALAASGARITVHRLPSEEEPDLVAAIELHSHSGRGGTETELLAAVATRRTDRRPFTHWPVPDAFVSQLVERAAEQGAVLRLVSDSGSTDVLVKAIQTAAAAQEKLPEYRDELASWSGREGDDGIPAANLLHTPTNMSAARNFSGGVIETSDTALQEGATLMLLGTASDDRLSQLRAGEALSAVLLQATQFGLATCPLSQPLEVGTTRKILQDDVLDGTMSPQIVLRLGWPPAGSSLPPTPRRPVSDTIIELPRP